MNRSAVIGYVHPDLVHARFMDSVLAAVERYGYPVLPVYGGVNISDARNRLVRRFLDETGVGWLFMTDTDMVFTADAVERLIARNQDIISGTTLTGDGGPALWRIVSILGRERHVPVFPAADGSLMEIDAAGAACLLARRSVYETVLARKFSVAAPWFQEADDGESLVGEDFTFCRRARACGYRICADTGVRVGHVRASVTGEVR